MGLYKRENNWYIDYYINGRRKREKVGTSKKLAEKVYSKRLTQVAERKYLDIRKESNITLSDMADIFMRDYSIPNKKSSKRDRQLLNSLIDFFGDIRLADITPHDIEKYKAYRVTKVKNSTVNRGLACLKTLFNKAVEWNYVHRNPVRKIKFFNEESNKRQRYLSESEIYKLIQNCHAQYLRDIIIIALNTGLRLSKVLYLKWEDIDFAEGLLLVRNTKSGKNHEVPINDWAMEILMRRSKEKSNDTYVFCYSTGTKIKTIYKGFKKALSKAGIEDINFHDLRHTFASHVVMNGGNLLTLKELLDHSTINVTLRYAHLAPNEEKRTVQRLAKKWAKIGDNLPQKGKKWSQIGHKAIFERKSGEEHNHDNPCVTR